MTRFDVIVVAYNRPVDQTDGIRTFIESDFVHRVVICDNSTDRSILRANAEQAPVLSPKIVYVPMKGNRGLAKAYNCGLQDCESDFVAIFDDDTAVPAEYFEKVDGYCEREPADIYLPIVRSRDIIMSPCIKRGFSFKAIRSVNELTGVTNISAINSGMVVRRAFYEQCRYDERLFVDGIDHRFMDEAREAHAHIVVMHDVHLMQQYSQEIHDEARQIIRLRIRAKDSRVYYGNTMRERMHCVMMIQYWKLKLAIKYRDPGILLLRV